jgi:hypothetical protein
VAVNQKKPEDRREAMIGAMVTAEEKSKFRAYCDSLGQTESNVLREVVQQLIRTLVPKEVGDAS